ncbi:MAG: SGNH/GDSL hydrolase family protein, partial [Acidimicrobiales bacterium]
PLWVALGDSTAQGVGASAYDRGYVGLVLAELRRRDARWRVLNLSRSGARIVEVVADQLPRLEAAGAPDLVTCAVGANDLVRARLRRVLADLANLVEALPPGAVVATLPQGLGRRRTARVNTAIRSWAGDNGLGVADVWARTGPPWAGKFAADAFHPNDTGYADWAAAVLEAAAGSVPP